jgi:uncharacterized membrane protein
MNPQEAIQNVWRQLVQRRLLPVAVLLVGALAAVPFLLAKDPAPAPAVPSASSAQESGAELDDPVVSLVTEDAPAQRRRVLGYRKDPFEPAAAPKVKAEKTTESETATAPAGGDAGKDESTGGSSAPAGSPSEPTPAAPAVPDSGTEAPARKYELYSLTVRFGASDSEILEKLNLPRLKALPSAGDPLLVYLGPGKGAKSAIFMVDAEVESQGDGTCDPSPANCETIELREGETEFFDVHDETGAVTAQYQLDLVHIKRSTTASAAKARAARAKVSKAGARALRARNAASGPLRYRFDAESGTVRKIGKRAYKALLAKSARIALGTAGGF